MQTVKLLSGGRITVPADVRKRLDMRPGDTIQIEQADGQILFYSLDAEARRSMCPPTGVSPGSDIHPEEPGVTRVEP